MISSQPSSVPSSVPTDQPTSQPSSSPTTQPSSAPSGQPSSQPTTRPSRQPTQRPSSQPTSQPTRQPSCQPTSLPSSLPTTQPSSLPSTQPSVQPTGLPSSQPSSVPSSRPTNQPSRRPTSQPSRQPTTQPSVQPTSHPSSLRQEYVNITGILLISRATTEAVINVQVAEKLLSNLFCYPIPQPSARQLPPVLPKSANEVITKGKETTIYFINNLVSLTGLSPVTNYTVYCLTVSLEGDVMPYKLLLQNALHFTTTCCKTIDVSISKSVVSVSSTVQNAVSLSLSNPPSTLLQLSCSLVSMTNPTVSISFFPTLTTFSGISTSLAQAYTFSIPTAGRYMLEVKTFGTSASEFQVNYLTSRYMNASLPTNLPPPALVSAMFNDDGTLVSVSFDQATNRGGYTNLFPCSALLSFTGVSQSQCRWQDDQNIAISQQSNSINGNSNILLSTGDPIALFKNNTVTAKCNLQYGGGCPILICLPRTVFIATAVNPVQPKVIIHAPSSISSCASLTLDISNSVGSGGRKWKSYKIEIFNSNSYDNDALSNYINNNRTYSLLPASAIPSLLLRKGSVYSFTVTLCNFLGSCGKNSIEVAISNSTYSLSLNILGNTQISIYPKDSLLIQAVGFVQTCGTSIPLTNDGKTDYKWTLSYVNGTVLPMTTISQNKLYFKLNPYSLHPATNYMITLTVRIAQFSLSQASSASVQVQTDNVVASVVPSTFTSKPQQFILLDGTSSTDLNYPRDSFEQFGIRFQWGCLQVLPVFNASFCSFKFSQTNVLGKNQKLTYSALNATAGPEAINSTVRIYLTVSKSGKSNTNYADIKIVSFVPKTNDVSVSVLSGSSSNFNTQVALVLVGQIKVVSPCNSVWSVDDSSIALKNISLTPVSVTMDNLGLQSIYLSLRPNSLPGGSSLTFSLNCAGLTQLSISTNSPPLPGTFSVSPLTGQSLSTSFKFQALFWSDADLPLSYQFNYYSSRISSNVIIRGQNPSTTSSSILPEGSALWNYQIQCLLQVFDSLKAQSVRTANLTVVPSTNSSISSSFLNILRSQSSGQDASTDNSRVAVSIVATSLTKVNCSNLPFSCTALRRNPCSSLSQTCGDCLNGFIGDSQANSLCLTVSEYYILQGQSPTLSPTFLPSASSPSLLHLQESNQISSIKSASLALAAVGVNQRCTSNSQCPLWYSCDKGRRRCLLASKECTLNCLGNGNCTFQNINNADPLEKCFVNDPTCISTCQCDSGFTGAFCQYRTTDWLTRQKTASLAMEVLFNLTRTDDINDQTLSSWTQLLQLLSSSPQLLDQPGMKMGIEVAVKAFQVANNRSLTTSAMSSSLIIALDNLATVLEITSYQLERFHNSSSIVQSSVNNSFVNSFGLNSILDQFILFKLGGIFLAEKDQSELLNQFRYLLAARKFITALGLSSSITLVVPQTDFELISNLGKTTVEIISRNDSASSIQEQAFTISVVEIRASNYQNKVHLVANPLKLLMQPINSIFVNQSMEYLSKFIDSVQFTIPFIKTMERYSDEFVVKNFSSFCAGENDRTVYNYFCEDSGTTIHHNCTGKRGIFVSHCPQPIPVCSSVIRNEFGFESFLPLNNCRLLNYSADFAQCKCQFSERIAINESLFFFRNRRLDSSSNSSEISYFHRNLYNLKEQSELTVTTTYIPYKYADTFSDETVEPVIWSGWVFLLIYFPTFALLSSLSYWYYSIRMVIKRRKKNPKKKVVPSSKAEKVTMNGEKNKVPEPHQFDQSAYQDQKLVHPFNPNLLTTSEECAEEYLSFVNSVFPVLYQDCSYETLDRSNWKSYFTERIQQVWVEITSHHNYLQFLFVDKIKIKNDLSQLFPHFRKIQRLFMCQLFILFLLVALFNIQMSDDKNISGLESCSSFSGQKDCESVKSALDSSTSHCIFQLKETSPTILRPTTLDPLVFDYECVSNDTFSLINPFVMMIVIIISIVASHFLGGWMDYFLEQFDSRLVPKPFFNLVLNQQQQSNKSSNVNRVFPDSPLSREENMIKAEVVEEGEEEQWEKNIQGRREEVVVSPHSSPSFLKRITSSNQILPAELSPKQQQRSEQRDSQYRIIPHYSSLIRKKFKNESFKLRLQEMILQSEILASNNKYIDAIKSNADNEIPNNSLSSAAVTELMDFRVKLDSVLSVYSKLSVLQDSTDYEEAEGLEEEREKGVTPGENELKQEEIQDFLDLFDSEWKFIEHHTLQEESQEQFRKEYEKIQKEVPNETKDLFIQSLNIMPEEHQAIELMYLHIQDQIASTKLSLFTSSEEQGKQSIPSKLFEMKFNDYFRLTSLSNVWPTVYLKLGVLGLGVLFVFYLVYSILLLLSHGSQFQEKVLVSFAIAIGVDLFILETSRCFLIYYYFPALEFQTIHSVYQRLKEQSMETMENLFPPRLPEDELERNPQQANDEKDNLVSLSAFIKSLNGNNNCNKIPFNSNQFFNSLHNFVFQYYFNRTELSSDDDYQLPAINDDYVGTYSELNPKSLLIENILILSNQDIFPSKSLHKKIHPTELLSLPPYIIPYSTLKDNIPQRKSSRSNVVVPDPTTPCSPQKEMNNKKTHGSHFHHYDDSEEDEEEDLELEAAVYQQNTTTHSPSHKNNRHTTNNPHEPIAPIQDGNLFLEESSFLKFHLLFCLSKMVLMMIYCRDCIIQCFINYSSTRYYHLLVDCVILSFFVSLTLLIYYQSVTKGIVSEILLILLLGIVSMIHLILQLGTYFFNKIQQSQRKQEIQKKKLFLGGLKSANEKEELLSLSALKSDDLQLIQMIYHHLPEFEWFLTRKREEEEFKEREQEKERELERERQREIEMERERMEKEEAEKRRELAAAREREMIRYEDIYEEKNDLAPLSLDEEESEEVEREEFKDTILEVERKNDENAEEAKEITPSGFTESQHLEDSEESPRPFQKKQIPREFTAAIDEILSHLESVIEKTTARKALEFLAEEVAETTTQRVLSKLGDRVAWKDGNKKKIRNAPQKRNRYHGFEDEEDYEFVSSDEQNTVEKGINSHERKERSAEDDEDELPLYSEEIGQHNGNEEGNTLHSVPSFVPVFQEQESEKRLFSSESPETIPLKTKGQYAKQATTRSENKKKIQQEYPVAGSSSKLWKAMATTTVLTTPTKEIINSKETGSFFSRLHLSLAEGSSKSSQKNLMTMPANTEYDEEKEFYSPKPTTAPSRLFSMKALLSEKSMVADNNETNDDNNNDENPVAADLREPEENQEIEKMEVLLIQPESGDDYDHDQEEDNKNNTSNNEQLDSPRSPSPSTKRTSTKDVMIKRKHQVRKKRKHKLVEHFTQNAKNLLNENREILSQNQQIRVSSPVFQTRNSPSSRFFFQQQDEEENEKEI
jgi:hypothetical protein